MHAPLPGPLSSAGTRKRGRVALAEDDGDEGQASSAGRYIVGDMYLIYMVYYIFTCALYIYLRILYLIYGILYLYLRIATRAPAERAKRTQKERKNRLRIYLRIATRAPAERAKRTKKERNNRLRIYLRIATRAPAQRALAGDARDERLAVAAQAEHSFYI